MRLERWDQLKEGVPEWARGGMQNARVERSCWKMVQTEEAVGGLFQFLKTASNLRLLHLYSLPFTSLDATDSRMMRATLFLPLLDDLTVSVSARFPHFVISDILATTDRRLSRLTLEQALRNVPATHSGLLNFGGNLRYLRVDGIGSSMVQFQPVLRSLVGLQEMYIGTLEQSSGDRAAQILAAVASTLEKLTISVGNFSEIAGSLPLLTRLTLLSLPRIPASLQSLLLPPAPLSFNSWTTSISSLFSTAGTPIPLSFQPASSESTSSPFTTTGRTSDFLPSPREVGHGVSREPPSIGLSYVARGGLGIGLVSRKVRWRGGASGRSRGQLLVRRVARFGCHSSISST